MSDLPPVPATLKLPVFGHTVTVQWVDGLQDAEGESLLGEAVFMDLTIRLDTDLRNKPVSVQWNVLLHEYVHTFLFHQGRNDLAFDEPFVETVSQALLQLISTLRGEPWEIL